MSKQNKMKCREIHQNISSYINGSLSGQEFENFESHLETCTSCAQLLANVTSTLSSIDVRAQLQPNPYLYTRLIQEIENRKQKGWIAGMQRILQPIAFVAILIIGVYLGIGLGNNYVVIDEEYASTEMQNFVDDYLFNDMDYEPIESFLLDK